MKKKKFPFKINDETTQEYIFDQIKTSLIGVVVVCEF